MRVLVVSQYFWPETFRINELVAELVVRGHQVTVLTGIPNYPEGHVFPDYQKDPKGFRAYAGAEVIRIAMAPRRKGNLCLLWNYLTFCMFGVLQGTWALRGRAFDRVFVFEVSPVTVAIPALWFRLIKRAPLLIWILDLWPETLAAVGIVKSPKLLNCVGKLVEFIYRRCDRLLIQSQSFRSNIKEHGASEKLVEYFPAWSESLFTHALDLVEFAPEIVPFLGEFNILFAGNVGEAQDFPAILEAAEVLRDRSGIHWLIVGDGRAAGWVRAEVVRRGLESSVHLLGRFPLERMPAFFKGADALLVSLRSDPVFALTIPGKVQSYLAAGIPILGMLDGEGGRVIVEAEAGLVCSSGNGKALARNVRALADLPESARRTMGERGRQYAACHFDRKNLLDRLDVWLDTTRYAAQPSVSGR